MMLSPMIQVRPVQKSLFIDKQSKKKSNKKTERKTEAKGKQSIQELQ